jgi:hypothetical protein
MQTLGLLRETSILMWPCSPRPVPFSMRRLAIFGHHVPSVEHLQSDTFTYTVSQLLLDKLFIIMAKRADAADLKSKRSLMPPRSTSSDQNRKRKQNQPKTPNLSRRLTHEADV